MLKTITSNQMLGEIGEAAARLRFLNIGLVPILVGLFAVGLGVVRTQRRKITVQG